MKKYRKLVIIMLSVFVMLNVSYAFAFSDENNNNDKVVYLTFDDGPTNTTLEVLKILKEEDVKGTFFVIGKLAEENKEILESVKKEGHSICVHTYTHNNSNYRCLDSYMRDYTKVEETLKNNLDNKAIKFMRMPGGSSSGIPQKSTLKQIRDNLVKKGLYYVDWNVSIEDAVGVNVAPEKLISNYSKAMNKKTVDKSRVIILMHDGMSNTTTPKALPSIIKSLKEQGYEFKTLDMVDDNELEILIDKKLINRYNKKDEE